MPSKSDTDSTVSTPLDTRARIHQLTQRLLDHYRVTLPPVPIDEMLRQPVSNLWDTNPEKVSSIIGHGLYRYAPRLAAARLLYRYISDSAGARAAGFDAPWPAARREVKYFARCLLMPEDWIRALPEADRTPDVISEKFQVTSFDALIRLAELGLPVPDGAHIDPD
ncbi:MAG: ImmA/IrrE family metallo-endopeptidase [Chloroflexi bacterium]|nr:ImmA/IrrE family metallo-endopeptidase [Chloroflexota bacterium]